MRRPALAVLLAAAVVGCGGGDDERPRAATPVATATTPEPAVRDVRRSHCPAEVTGCRAVRGTVIFVEPVDPDGDGDLHVVLTAGSVTGPGITAVDVAPERRPRRDPRVGDRASAAGPVQTGSYGQSQIHALEFRVSARRGR
ncbi:MAG TPA: hypothetical protein VFP78_03860 [Solirubrobacteraceae bacterium]|nr:hypothetical protein [Solirubrobacteraceae bacterium]